MKRLTTSITSLSLFLGVLYAEDINYSVNADTDFSGSIYVGGSLSADESAEYQNVNIDISGGVVSAKDQNTYWKDGIFGGASEFGNDKTSFSADKVSITMTGGDVNNVIAGSFAVEKAKSSIGLSEITISGGLVRNSVLGGSVLTYNNATSVGMANSHVGLSKIIINGNAVIGETVLSAKDKSDNNDIIFSSVYGGGYTAGYGTQSFGSTDVSIGENAVVNGVVIGGSHAGPTGQAYVGNKEASDFSQVVSNVSISDNAQIRGGYVFGGAYHSWGDGSKSSDIYGSTHVSITGGKIFNETEGTGYVFGGGYSSDGNNTSQASNTVVWGNTNVDVSGGKVGNVYGGNYVNEAFGYGSALGEVKGNTNIVITGGSIENVFGGGLTERVSGAEGLTVKTSVLGDTNIVISDTAISGNVYGGGNGQDSSVLGNSNITLTGNASVGGIISGNGANGATVNGTKTLNIGTSESSYTGGSTLNIGEFDNINVFASGNPVSLNTNSFDGVFSLNSGTVNINNALNANSITVNSGAALGLNIAGNNTLANSNLILRNNGTIIMTANANLEAGNYTVSAAGITDFGNVKAYGGTFAENTFVVSEAKLMNLDVQGDAITLSNNGRVMLSDSQTQISMAFNSTSATVNSVTTTTDSLIETVGSEFVKIGAYDFDVSMQAGDTVVLSFLIGDATLSLDNFTIFHKSENGQWEEADDVSNLNYDGEYLSFVVSHFSEYGFTAAVPEPSTYAAILGAIALAFAAYRRRK